MRSWSTSIPPPTRPQTTGTDPIYYNGPLAFDRSGQVWMGAEDLNVGSTFLVAYGRVLDCPHAGPVLRF
jgi:hypothetical protein